MFKWIEDLKHKHIQGSGVLEFLKFVGPGILVTVGFIDPGNWATNISAGAQFGYSLLWVVTISTIILILLQHNAAHLGIVTGKCLSECATDYLSKKASIPILTSAMIASVATTFAELLGGAIALQILFNIPLIFGGLIMFAGVSLFTFLNAYSKIEKVIISFVSIIGFSFIFELVLVNPDWGIVAKDTFVPSIPQNSLYVILGVIGAVVMPHNLYLHSEVIQSRQWHLEEKHVIKNN
jgi:Mn2+ and Fe2+ transporters of the NRAMP family